MQSRNVDTKKNDHKQQQQQKQVVEELDTVQIVLYM